MESFLIASLQVEITVSIVKERIYNFCESEYSFENNCEYLFKIYFSAVSVSENLLSFSTLAYNAQFKLLATSSNSKGLAM